MWPELIPDVTAEQIRYLRPRARSSVIPTTPSSSASGGRQPGPTNCPSGIGMASKEESLEMVRLMGEHVIPKIDTDPVHRTTRMREAAAAKL